MNPPLSVDHFQSFATANPPKSDDWKWSSTDKGAFIIDDFLRNPYFSTYSDILLHTVSKNGFLKKDITQGKDYLSKKAKIKMSFSF